MRATLGVMLVAGLALPAAAPDVTATTRAYGRVAAFPLAEGFVGAYEREQDGSYLLEFVPEGESVQDWSQMITLSAAKDLARDMPNPLDAGSAIGAGFRETCPDTFRGSDEGAQDVAGADAAHLVLFSCGDAGGYAESALILVAVSGTDVFTLQWAVRGEASDGPIEPAIEEWAPRGAALLSLRLCPVVEGEAPPYPSCLE